MEFLPQAFEALRGFNQFIVYILSPSKTRQDKSDKFPVDYRTGQIANAHDPSIWTDANTALTYAKRLGGNYGIGFVFTDKDPFWFLDIDECVEQPANAWSTLAQTLLSAFGGAAVEVSASGKGLHIIGTGISPPHSCRNTQHKLEFYTSGRFVALTGIQAMGNAGLNCTPVIEWLVQHYFPQGQNPIKQEWTNTPCDQWNMRPQMTQY